MPNLRYPKLVHTWDRKAGRRVVVDSEYSWRYGPKRAEIIRHVLEQGRVERPELHAKFGSKTSRPGRFFDTWVKPMFDDGVFHEPAGAVEMAPDWREALERVRLRTDEDGDNRRQRERYARNRAAYRERLEAERRGEAPKPEPAPALEGNKEKTRRKYAELDERDAELMEAERRAAMAPAAAFVRRTFGNLEVARLGLLEDLWREEGGLRWHLRRVLRDMGCTPKRHAEHPGEWFVYPPATWPEPGPDVRTQKPRRGESVNPTPKKESADVLLMPKRAKNSGGGPPAESPPTGDRADVFRNNPMHAAKTNPYASQEILTNANVGGAPRGLPPKVNGVHTHGPECACWMCEDEAPAASVVVGASA